MDAWSLMRGDAFIHFVCGSRRVNIRLGVILLIPKSPQPLSSSSSTIILFYAAHFEQKNKGSKKSENLEKKPNKKQKQNKNN